MVGILCFMAMFVVVSAIAAEKAPPKVVEHANAVITAMGSDPVIVQAVLAENLFRTPSQVLKKFMAKLWFHSLCCAYSNENIALTLRFAHNTAVSVIDNGLSSKSRRGLLPGATLFRCPPSRRRAGFGSGSAYGG